MKKNISVIYRLAFILFSIWAILESAAFQLSALPVKLLNFTVLSDFICMICILIVLIFTMRHRMGQGLYAFKTACTFLALVALASNLSMLFALDSGSWILRVLLPLMMLLDHVFFDDNGKLKLWQMLLWLLAAAFIGWLLYVLADKFLNLPNVLDLLGLFKDKNSLADLILNTLILTGLAYLLDRLFSGALFRDIKSMFALLFRLLFLALEAWAFIRLSGMNLKSFINALRYYEILINFLCFLCIAAVLIYNVLRSKASAKSASVFSKIKCFFTICIVFAFIVYHFYVRGDYRPDAVGIILYYVAPAMMLMDWLFFDYCSSMRAYEPLIWMCVPVGYFALILLLARVGYINLYPTLMGLNAYITLGIYAAGMLIIGYIFYFIDRIIKGR
ncbi:MAG: hypothetical protein IJD83_08340 [Clostridia bacterium]|nr:hypothetical protein [Clostridia bacterium]